MKFDQSGSFLSRVKKLYDPATLAVAPSDGQESELIDLADTGIDDEIADPYEELIEAGDESQDAVAQAAEAVAEPAAIPVARPTDFAPTSSDFEERRAALPAIGEVRELFAQLQVHRGEGGKIVIEAPPEAASTLGALFQGMAALLQEAARNGR
ncbi:MAG: hypothetical protein U0790_12390 [Isosphaeraceae bacterium]